MLPLVPPFHALNRLSSVLQVLKLQTLLSGQLLRIQMAELLLLRTVQGEVEMVPKDITHDCA